MNKSNRNQKGGAANQGRRRLFNLTGDGRSKAKPRSIGDLEFAGMWAHRDDIIDGVSYVNSLRQPGR